MPETNCDHELFNRVVSMATLKTYFYTALSSDEHYGWQYIFLVCIITSNTTLGLRLLNAKKQICIYFSCFLGKNNFFILCIVIGPGIGVNSSDIDLLPPISCCSNEIKLMSSSGTPQFLCLIRKLKEVIINQNKLPRFNL